MSRLIRFKPPSAGVHGVDQSWSNRLERVAKFVPSEVLAAHMFLNGIASGAATEHRRTIYNALSFVICLIATPLIFGVIAQSGDDVRFQQVASTIAFVAWSYSIGSGIFVAAGLYDPIAAAFVITTFTLITAFLPTRHH